MFKKLLKKSLSVFCATMVLVGILGFNYSNAALCTMSGYYNMGSDKAHSEMKNTSGSTRYCVDTVKAHNGNASLAVSIGSINGVMSNGVTWDAEGVMGSYTYAVGAGYVYNSSNYNSGVAYSTTIKIK